MTAQPLSTDWTPPLATNFRRGDPLDRARRSPRPTPPTGISRSQIIEAALVDAGALQVARGGDVRELLEQIGLTPSDRDIVLAELDRAPRR